MKLEKTLYLVAVTLKADIGDFRWALSKYERAWDLFLFNLGINVRLRLSDLVPLTFQEVRWKMHFVITEQK